MGWGSGTNLVWRGGRYVASRAGELEDVGMASEGRDIEGSSDDVGVGMSVSFREDIELDKAVEWAGVRVPEDVMDMDMPLVVLRSMTSFSFSFSFSFSVSFFTNVVIVVAGAVAVSTFSRNIGQLNL